jgi:hypothetical protein
MYFRHFRVGMSVVLMNRFRDLWRKWRCDLPKNSGYWSFYPTSHTQDCELRYYFIIHIQYVTYFHSSFA